jgi:hypothetical protein
MKGPEISHGCIFLNALISNTVPLCDQLQQQWSHHPKTQKNTEDSATSNKRQWTACRLFNLIYNHATVYWSCIIPALGQVYNDEILVTYDFIQQESPGEVLFGFQYCRSGKNEYSHQCNWRTIPIAAPVN